MVSRAGSAVGFAWSEFNAVRTEQWLVVLFVVSVLLLVHTCSALLKAPRVTEAEVLEAATWRGRGFFSRLATQVSATLLFTLYLPVTRYALGCVVCDSVWTAALGGTRELCLARRGWYLLPSAGLLVVITLALPAVGHMIVARTRPKLQLFDEAGAPLNRKGQRAAWRRDVEEDLNPFSFLYWGLERPWSSYRIIAMYLKAASVFAVVLLDSPAIAAGRDAKTAAAALVLAVNVLYAGASLATRPFLSRSSDQAEAARNASAVLTSVLALVACRVSHAALGWTMLAAGALSLVVMVWTFVADTPCLARQLDRFGPAKMTVTHHRLGPDLLRPMENPDIEVVKMVGDRLWVPFWGSQLFAKDAALRSKTRPSSLTFSDSPGMPAFLLNFAGTVQERHIENVAILRDVGMERYRAALAAEQKMPAYRTQCREIVRNFLGPDCRWKGRWGCSVISPFPFTVAFFPEEGEEAVAEARPGRRPARGGDAARAGSTAKGTASGSRGQRDQPKRGGEVGGDAAGDGEDGSSSTTLSSEGSQSSSVGYVDERELGRKRKQRQRSRQLSQVMQGAGETAHRACEIIATPEEVAQFHAENNLPEVAAHRQLRVAARALHLHVVSLPHTKTKTVRLPAAVAAAAAAGSTHFTPNTSLADRAKGEAKDAARRAVARVKAAGKAPFSAQPARVKVTFAYERGVVLVTETRASHRQQRPSFSVCVVFRRGVGVDPATGTQHTDSGLILELRSPEALAELVRRNRPADEPLRRVEQGLAGIRSKAEESFDYKAKTLSYSFLTDVVMQPLITEPALVERLSKEKALAGLHASGLLNPLLDARRAVLAGGPRTAWWWLVWEDIFRNNTIRLGGRKAQGVFGPLSVGSIGMHASLSHAGLDEAIVGSGNKAKRFLPSRLRDRILAIRDSLPAQWPPGLAGAVHEAILRPSLTLPDSDKPRPGLPPLIQVKSTASALEMV